MNDTLKLKLIGSVRVPIVKNISLEERISKATKEQLGVVYEKSKHSFKYNTMDKQIFLGSAQYNIFEKLY